MRLSGAALLIGLTLLTGCSNDDTPSDRTRHAGGPLRPDPAYVSYYEMDPVGTKFSEGFLILKTTEPITLQTLSVEGGGGALEFLGARIGLPGRPDDFAQFMTRYPPKAVPSRYQTSAEGARLSPENTYMAIIGYRVIEHVMDLRERVTVEYKTNDGTEYVREFPAQVVACPPPLTDNRCLREAHERYGERLAVTVKY